MAFTAILLLLPLLVLVMVEAGLRLWDDGSDFALARRVVDASGEWWEINQNVARRYFGMAPEFARQTEEGRVRFRKTPQIFRVICLGESSMAGFPYNKNATLPGILRTYLQMLLPQHEVEVLNLGIAATNSFTVRDLMPEVVALLPDVILIYVGHNEFYGALGAGSRFHLGSNRRVIHLYLRLLRLHTFRLLQRGVRKVARTLRGGGSAADFTAPVMQQMAREQTIPPGSRLRRLAENALEQNLLEALAIAQAARIPVVISELVSNLREQPPFVSVANAALTPAERQRWQSAVNAGWQHLQAGRPDSALAGFALAAALDSTHAELRFRWAQACLAAGEQKQAARLFAAARDEDALPFRAPGSFNTVLRRVSVQRNVPLVEMESLFRARSHAGIIGDEYICEHLHPTVAGYALMAKAFLARLQTAGLLPAGIDADAVARLPEEARQLNITALDEEIGRLRILQLTAAWPFRRQIELHVTLTPEVAPLATQTALRYINREITWPQAHLTFADQLMQRKRFDLALGEYRALLAQYPGEAGLWEKQGDALFSLQQYDEARRAYAQAAKLQPGSAFAHAGVGKACLFLSRYAEAEAAFARALQCEAAQPQFDPAYRSFVLYLWGGALTNLQRYAEAEQKLEAALAVDPLNKLAGDFLATLRRRLPQ
ncbi:MAG: tetratricopeptide repeat protein [candidate division KSB1 bacterium]|nr:tetratricopeptide repeat protein [candidate division KSB1 bacterium]MDZ7275523.1 tetratricopeptide repeat protein [candidate division KSB1 bacterium]MDZ7286165.1 tetratricopeptide repeat protein [candidate division KSB1 bacterium]MDZ7296391.1 tetratricopeptide repeat protein [candidate division KSB1 bacterium]MDZ7306226.1 tetratricopeptide repeat protein [candidate division KSB1 bacterium]